MRKTIRKFSCLPVAEIRIDTAFEQVITACARRLPISQTPDSSTSEPADQDDQDGQGTWILPSMVKAYTALHHAGFAHSIEAWVDGQLVGGLYCVAIGRAVFGESMFSHRTDASKIALAALVAFCRVHDIPQIDCQQNTQHLASLGAAQIARTEFLTAITQAQVLPSPLWKFDTLYWQTLLQKPATPTPTTTRLDP